MIISELKGKLTAVLCGFFFLLMQESGKKRRWGESRL